MAVPNGSFFTGAHLALIVGITALLVLAMVYPFLPGAYDPLAATLSTLAQVFGVVGLALVPCGLLWLMLPKHRTRLALLTVVIAICVALILVLVAFLGGGNVWGMMVLVASVFAGVRLIPKLKRLNNADSRAVHLAPVYLVCLPVLAFSAQLALAGPVTRWSKDRAIANAAEFIGAIERYHDKHLRYPVSLHAQYRDYYPDIVGIERYLYMAQGASYNLAFEQPRFLLDRLGTREWVVYNPRDEHRMYSHTAWLLLPPEVTRTSQGWYETGDTGRSHWKYFLFD